MKITAITVFQVTLPLTKPYWLSGGRLKFEELDSTLLRIDTDAGVSGWGEGCPWGVTYLPAFGKGIRAGIAELAPLLLGLDPRRLDQINHVMDKALPGHPYVKSALDIACWDILGRSTGLPVVDLLGGRYAGAVPIASSISTGTPDEMEAYVQEYRDQGYYLHSAKVGADVARDIERIRHLIERKPAGETIFFDANRAWLPEQAMTVMNAVSDLPVFFEQPCETLDQCLQVRRRTRQPISLDESVKEFGDLLRIQREGIGEIVNIKINRVGGLTKARRLRDFCLEAGIAILVMETGGSVLADTAAVSLAQSIPPECRRGTWLCHDMLTLELAPKQGARNHNGAAAAPELPGLGVTPDSGVLGEAAAKYG